jgi:DNA-binding transcriptional MerR regulator
MSGYTAQDVARMLGLTPSRLRAYIRSGVLSPERGERGELRFSFQDLALLRTAEGLVRERVPPRRVVSALLELRRRLPDAQPLTGVPLGAEGSRVVVREGSARWHAESGQVLLDFTPAPSGAAEARGTLPALGDLPARRAAGEQVAPTTAADLTGTTRLTSAAPANLTNAVGPAESADVAPLTIDELYELGCELEETDPAHAEASYVEVLARSPRHADANINLGRLLHERGDLEGAEAHYLAALAHRPDDPTATFNLGVALEDQGRLNESLQVYERAIRLNASNADAHYNAARLYEKTGDYSASLRHLRAYRDLTRRGR